VTPAFADNNNVTVTGHKSGLWLMIALLALVAAGKAILYDTLDPDCFWHLRVAEQLQHDGIGPLVDHISYASIKTPWTPYSWLAELGMKALWDVGGYRAAVLVQALMMGAFVVLVALCAMQLQRDENPLAVVLATVFAMYFSLPYLSFRPVTFVIVLLALSTWLILRDRRLEERSRAVWWVVPITTLMTNCHFFSVLVPLWLSAMLIGALIGREHVRRYALLLGCSILACCATPMFPGMVRAMWVYQFSDPMVGAGMIAEFQPVWAGSLGIVAVALLLVWIVLTLRNRRELGPGIIIWSAFATLLLLRLGRFAPVFAPIAAATLATSMPRLSATALSRRAARVAIACVLVAGAMRLTFAFPGAGVPLSAWVNRHGPETPGFPTEAADFVALRTRSGRIINEFSWGGYLAWRLGDKYPVLLDGRTQLYPPQLWRQIYAKPKSTLPLNDYHASAAILPINRSRFRDELLQAGWTSAFHDDRAEVLFPPPPLETNAFIRE
jgi:hypothetical protein